MSIRTSITMPRALRDECKAIAKGRGMYISKIAPTLLKQAVTEKNINVDTVLKEYERVLQKYNSDDLVCVRADFTADELASIKAYCKAQGVSLSTLGTALLASVFSKMEVEQ